MTSGDEAHPGTSPPVTPSPGEDPLAWLDEPDEATGQTGLRFSCTQCGNCCSGPPGVVRFTSAEGERLAARLGVTIDEFADRYTQLTPMGLSLGDKPGPDGSFDCVFLDRESSPGHAVCGVYEDRPSQCRTWPFWPRTLRSRGDWAWHARSICPGMNHGTRYTPQQVRVMVDRNDP